MHANQRKVDRQTCIQTRCNNISKSFFQDICEPNSSLYHLIPPVRDTSVTTRLRRTTPFPRPVLSTKILFIYKVWPTSLPINEATPSCSTSHIPPTTHVHMHNVCFSFVCLLLFLSVILAAVFNCYPAPGLQGC